MRTIFLNVYKYKELPLSSKKKAYEAMVTAMVETYQEEDASEGMIKAAKTAENLKTPWFFGTYVQEFCEEEIQEYLDDNEYFQNGNMYVEGLYDAE